MKTPEDMNRKIAQKNVQKALKTHQEESHNGAEIAEKIEALVRLMARIEAEKDFRLYLDYLQPPEEQ